MVLPQMSPSALPPAQKPKTAWSRVIFRSAVVAVLAAPVAWWGKMDAMALLAVLTGEGFLAGLWARRHGWLSGVIVGLPSAYLQIVRWAGPEAGAADWWRLALPVGLAATGMAVLGGMSGAWMQDMKLQRENGAR